jgi:hypothetical protein
METTLKVILSVFLLMAMKHHSGNVILNNTL